jgi:hypothetical protein
MLQGGEKSEKFFSFIVKRTRTVRFAISIQTLPQIEENFRSTFEPTMRQGCQIFLATR